MICNSALLLCTAGGGSSSIGKPVITDATVDSQYYAVWINSSPFQCDNLSVTHKASEWRFCANYDVDSATNIDLSKLSGNNAGMTLTQFYDGCGINGITAGKIVFVRYQGSNGEWSEWSDGKKVVSSSRDWNDCFN